MQHNVFVGRLAASPSLTRNGNTVTNKFTLIETRYAGKDKATGENKEENVSIQFTAFNRIAEVLGESAQKGDQLIVEYHITNNNYKKEGQDIYGFNFVVDSFEFGAPGKMTRSRLESGAGANNGGFAGDPGYAQEDQFSE